MLDPNKTSNTPTPWVPAARPPEGVEADGSLAMPVPHFVDPTPTVMKLAQVCDAAKDTAALERALELLNDFIGGRNTSPLLRAGLLREKVGVCTRLGRNDAAQQARIDAIGAIQSCAPDVGDPFLRAHPDFLEKHLELFADFVRELRHKDPKAVRPMATAGLALASKFDRTETKNAARMVLEMGQQYLAEKNYGDACSHLTRWKSADLVRLRFDLSERRAIHLATGQAYSGLQQPEIAYDHFMAATWREKGESPTACYYEAVRGLMRLGAAGYRINWNSIRKLLSPESGPSTDAWSNHLGARVEFLVHAKNLDHRVSLPDSEMNAVKSAVFHLTQFPPQVVQPVQQLAETIVELWGEKAAQRLIAMGQRLELCYSPTYAVLLMKIGTTLEAKKMTSAAGDALQAAVDCQTPLAHDVTPDELFSSLLAIREFQFDFEALEKLCQERLTALLRFDTDKDEDIAPKIDAAHLALGRAYFLRRDYQSFIGEVRNSKLLEEIQDTNDINDLRLIFLAAFYIYALHMEGGDDYQIHQLFAAFQAHITEDKFPLGQGPGGTFQSAEALLAALTPVVEDEDPSQLIELWPLMYGED